MLKRKIRIGIIVDQLLAGGVQLSAIEQVKILNKLGHQAKLVILMRKQYPTDFSYLLRGVPHEFLSDNYPHLFRKTFKFPIFSFFSSLHLLSPLLAPYFIQGRTFDVLVSMGTTTSLTTQAIYKRLRIPYLAVIHDPIDYILETSYQHTPLRFVFPILKPVATYFEQSFIKDAKATLIISSVHYNYLVKKYSIKPIILPIGTTPISRIPIKRGNYLLAFGRWQQRKNPQLLLELIRRIPDTKLLLAGSWTSSAELHAFKDEIIKTGLSHRIRLIPHYSQRMLKRLCESARLFLHPHFEAFGLAALEAAGHGVPIIVPEKSGVTEGFIHGIHGFFPSGEDVNIYARYVQKLYKDPHLAYRMGKVAWLKVKSHYSWKVIVGRLLDMIYKTCNLERKISILVLEIGHALSHTLAGGDKLMEPMARRMSKKYQFSVIVPEIGAQHWQESPVSKNLLILPKNIFDLKGTPLPVFLTYCTRMIEAIRILMSLPDRLDIIYSSTNILPDVLPAAFTSIFRPTFWVARVHHLIPPPHKREGRIIVNIVSYLMQQLALFLIKSKADLIIALNTPLKRELLKRNFPENKIEIVGAGIDLKSIISSKYPKNTQLYSGIFLGRLHPAKGIYDLVSIWKKVVFQVPDATLAIIGSGEPAVVNKLRLEIEAVKLADKISILGVLADHEVYALMKKAKVFLFTDHESGWGLAVAEAMANGLPVIGYNIGVLETIYKDGFRVVQLGNTANFANEVVKLLIHEREQLQLASRARKITRSLDWNLTTSAFNQTLMKHFTPRLL